MGELVTTLVNELQLPGIYEYNWDAGHFSSGVYYCEITAGKFRQVKKAVLLK